MKAFRIKPGYYYKAIFNKKTNFNKKISIKFILIGDKVENISRKIS